MLIQFCLCGQMLIIVLREFSIILNQAGGRECSGTLKNRSLTTSALSAAATTTTKNNKDISSFGAPNYVALLPVKIVCKLGCLYPST